MAIRAPKSEGGYTVEPIPEETYPGTCIGVYELGELGMFVLSCLACAFVQHRKAHVRVETLVTRMKDKPRDLTELLDFLALLFYAVILTWAGYVLAVTRTLQISIRLQ